jgi:hypothetical protein
MPRSFYRNRRRRRHQEIPVIYIANEIASITNPERLGWPRELFDRLK